MQDAPYSIFVTPHQLVENIQTYNLQDALKYDPDIQAGNGLPSVNSSRGAVSFTIRGVSGSSFTTDNIYNPNGFFTAPEDKESIAVLSGTSGFLYGVQAIGGHIDTELKRPTAKPIFEATGGTNTGHNGYGHIDVGGPLNFPGIDPGLFGYRLNLVDQGGGTTIHGQDINRNLASLALDAHLPDNVLVQLNASHSQYRIWGSSPDYVFPGMFPPPAPNPNSQYVPSGGIGKYANQDATGGIKVTWKPNDIFTLRTQYSYDVANLLIGSPGTGLASYRILATDQSQLSPFFAQGTGGAGSTNYTHAGYAYLDTDFDIFGTHHKVTTGFNGYRSESNLAGSALGFGGFTPIATCSLYNESTCPTTSAGPIAASTSGTNTGYVNNLVFQKNYLLGDEIKAWDDRIIILAGGNYASTGATTFNKNGTPNANRTDASAFTPTASLTYKVLPWLSPYVSYQQSLTAGAIVPQTSNGLPFTNAGALIPPFLGTEYEGGIKATVANNLLLTMAVFDLTQPALFQVNNGNGTFSEIIGGSKHVQGIEFKAVGKLWDDLAIYGGTTLLNPRLQATPTQPYFQGLQVPFVSPVVATAYAEYTIPFFAELPSLHGLTLTAGLRYTGPYKFQSPGTLASIPTFEASVGQGYAVGDLGFRYAYTINGHQAIFRFTVSNVTNYGYWNIGGGNAYLGVGRQYAATTEFKW